MERNTHAIDAQGKVAGRLASRIATLLSGKHKVMWQPYLDCGDIVAVNHVDQMHFTGRKLDRKKYYRASGYPGGLKVRKLRDFFEKRPDMVLRGMVYNMLPKNKLRDRMIKRLTFIKQKGTS